MGKLQSVSQPHALGGTVYWTTYAYDGLGRTTSVTLADGSVTTYAYDDRVAGTDAVASYVRVTDAAGKQKRYQVDGFGHLTRVTEDPNGVAYATTYAYDVLDHLKQVQQTRGTVTQTRTFNYVSGGVVTGFLRSATNPENGTVSYTYNTDGTLATKTDARSQQVSYSYDAYKRLKQITRPGGQNVVFYYDTNPFDSIFTPFTQNALGRLAAVKYQAGSPHTFVEMYSYTTAGEATGKRLQITYNCNWWYNPNGNQACGSARVFALDGHWTWDTEGRMSSQTWPLDQAGVDPSTSYGYDAMGRPNTLTETYNGNQYNLVTGSVTTRPTSR
jgi:YD repeat-containing protein